MNWLPITTWLPKYDRSWLKPDIFAGLTVWALVVPQAIAYAQIAGLPPSAGVFASFAAPLGYALFGTSRQLIVSPTSGTAAISAALIAPLAVTNDPGEYATLSAALAVLCGFVFVLLGRLRLGFVSQFIAPSVQTGFLVGLGLTIMIGQSFKVLGMAGEDGTFIDQAGYLIRHLGDIQGWTLAIGAASLVTLLAIGRLAPTFPVALVVVAASIVVVSIFDLADKGVAVVGSVDRAFPMPAIPTVSLNDLLVLIPGTLAIVVIGYSESMSVSRQFAERHDYTIRPNQELVALGMSSIFAGLFQSFISAGGASQSAANERAGAKSQVSALVLSALALLSAIALMPFFRNLPLAVLGAIVIYAVYGFVNIPAIKRFYALRRDSFLLACLATIGVLFLGILPGLLVAAAISIVLLLSRISRPHGSILGRVAESSVYASIDNFPDATQLDGLMIYRIDDRLLFVNASWVRDDVMSHVSASDPPPKVVVLDLEATAELDVSGIDMLLGLHHDLQQKNASLWVANVHGGVRFMIEKSELAIANEKGYVFPSIETAVDAYLRQYPA